jgi:hypothetical protein
MCNQNDKDARNWVRENVIFDVDRQGVTLQVNAAAVFPICDWEFYQLITHPDNHEVFRAVSGCVKRTILHNDGKGTMMLQVHNASDWNVLGLVHGTVVSKLLVEQSMSSQCMHFTAVPDSSSILTDLYGIWHVYNFSQPELRKFFPAGDAQTVLAEKCLVTLYQRFVFRESIPKVLQAPMERAAVSQIRRTFEDLVSEAWRIRTGRATLPPYMSSVMKEIHCEDSTCENESIESVKSLLQEKIKVTAPSQNTPEAISSKLKSRFLSIETDEGAEMDYSAHIEPRSHPVGSQTSLNRAYSLTSLDPEATPEEHPAPGVQRCMKRVRSLVDRYLGIDDVDTPLDYGMNDDDVFDSEWLVVA